MRRCSRYLFFPVAGILFAPLATHAATTTFFGPIIPTACNCAAEWGCVLQSFQNLMNVAIALGTVLITLYIALAGVAYLMAPISAEGRQKAKGRLLNAVLGLLIMLGAWLLIDSIMKVIYAGNSNTNPAGFLPWNSILTSGSGAGPCIVATSPPTGVPNPGSPTLASGGTPPAGTTAGSVSQNPNGACTTSALQSTFGNNAAAMSCVTKYENDSCNPKIPSGTDIGSDGNSVSFGLFQVNISSTNLSQYSACETAVNNQPLNCPSAFNQPYTGANSKYTTHVTNSSLYNTCISAADNPACNEQAAQAKLQSQGISAWGSAAQSNCSSLVSN